MKLLLAAMAFLTGVIIPVQIGVNALMGRWVGSPLAGALSSFTVGLMAVVAFSLATQAPMRAFSHWLAAPWYYWLGGVMGAIVVTSGLYIAPKVGAAVFMALLIAGQLSAAMIMDHFGWLGFPEIPFSWTRLLGASLLLGGVLLMARR